MVHAIQILPPSSRVGDQPHQREFFVVSCCANTCLICCLVGCCGFLGTKKSQLTIDVESLRDSHSQETSEFEDIRFAGWFLYNQML